MADQFPLPSPALGGAAAAAAADTSAILARHPVFASLLSGSRGALDLSLLPRLGPLLRAAEAVWAAHGSSTSGIVALALPGAPAGAPLVRISCDAVFDRSPAAADAARLPWHDRVGHREMRFAVVQSLRELLWAEAAAVVALDAGVAREALRPPDASSALHRALQTECLLLERGLYYGAESLGDYTDRATLEGRFVLLHAHYWARAHQAQPVSSAAPAAGDAIQAALFQALRSASGPPASVVGTDDKAVPFQILRLKQLIHARFCIHSALGLPGVCPDMGVDCVEDRKSVV